jgi:hypothetical protein
MTLIQTDQKAPGAPITRPPDHRIPRSLPFSVPPCLRGGCASPSIPRSKGLSRPIPSERCHLEFPERSEWVRDLLRLQSLVSHEQQPYRSQARAHPVLSPCFRVFVVGLVFNYPLTKLPTYPMPPSQDLKDLHRSIPSHTCVAQPPSAVRFWLFDGFVFLRVRSRPLW